jgi:DNA polymerase III subunit epsilon
MPDLFSQPLAIVDVETTGMSHVHGGVIDIGILRVENGQVVQTMRQLINPGSLIPAFITQLTGITNDDLADAPAFTDVAQDVYDLLEDCIFIAHNVRFDYAFIKEEMSRAGYAYRPKQLCTVKLSRSLYPEHRHHKLDALIERFNIQIQERHRAFADAEATWQALSIMASQQEEAVFNQHVAQQLRQPSLPIQLSSDHISNLPDSPGVYIFEGDNGATLYVGKSVDIRSRVLSHFSDDHRSAKEMRIAQELTNIRTIQTTGELGALLKESQLIKELLPIHNRLLRRQTEMVVAVKSLDDNGFPTVTIERHTQLEAADLPNIMGVFRSEKQAKEALIGLAKEHHLCHKLLGLQKTSGACFPHQLKICHGACVGKEISLEYGLRFNNAFESTRIRQWPFAGAIRYTEVASPLASTSYIIDKWCLVGIIEQQDQHIEYNQVEPQFDLDQYKIFKRFLENPKNRKAIKSYTYSPAMSPTQFESA